MRTTPTLESFRAGRACLSHSSSERRQPGHVPPPAVWTGKPGHLPGLGGLDGLSTRASDGSLWRSHHRGGAQQRVDADTADMSGCCDPRGCNELFGPRFARHLTSRYHKRGLDKTAARMAAYVVDRGIDGASVLEIGGGVGALQLELLAKGASRTTNLELVDAYDADANELAESAGMRDRMARRQVDIAATPDQVEAHDIVVL